MIRYEKHRNEFLSLPFRKENDDNPSAGYKDLTPEEAATLISEFALQSCSCNYHNIVIDTKEELDEVFDAYREQRGHYFNKFRKVEGGNPEYQLIWPWETDTFLIENESFMLSGGIRELDPRYRKYNTHAAGFRFGLSPLMSFYAAHLSRRHPNQSLFKSALECFAQWDETNHRSLKMAQQRLVYVKEQYSRIFNENEPFSVALLADIQRHFNIPWYEKKECSDL